MYNNSAPRNTFLTIVSDCLHIIEISEK